MTPEFKTIRTTYGFTLYEVVVVMAIIAVLSVISLFSYRAWIPEIRLNGAARHVMSDLIAARMTSVKENVNVVVSHVSDHSYEIAVGGGPAKTENLQADYPGTSLNFTSIVFYSRGTASPRTLTLQNSSGLKTITVAITGRVKIN